MAWHKYVNGRVEYKEDVKRVFIYSTTDSDSYSFEYPKRIQQSWWNEDGLCLVTEDGKRILVECVMTNNDFSFRGDVLTPEQSEKIRREEEVRQQIRKKYDGAIVCFIKADPLKSMCEVMELFRERRNQ